MLRVSSRLFGLKSAFLIVLGCAAIWLSTSESDAFSVLCPWPDSVCTASQTRAAMTISGKSALRKNRFKGPLFAGYQPNPWLKLGGRADQVRIQHAYIGQVSVPLGEIQPVS